MDSLLYEINTQFYETIVLAKRYFKDIEFTTIFLSVAFLYILFIRKWTLKKTFSFAIISALLFILFVRLEALAFAFFNPQDGNFLVGLGRTLFFITLGFVFFYYAAVKEE